MTHFLKRILPIASTVMVAIACGPDEPVIDNTGGVSFVVQPVGPDVGRLNNSVPSKLVLSVEAEDGTTIFDNEEFSLGTSDDGYRTENIPLAFGSYKVTKYIVLSGNEVAFVAPRAGASKANLLDKPLPYDFSVNKNKSADVAPGIIRISAEDEPEDFGYMNFGYNLPATGEWMDVRVKLELTLGDLLYQNIDAKVNVTAFDEEGVQKWSENFTYVGPDANDLRLKRGFARYSITFEKWGKALTQNFVESDLWEGRVREGSVPTTKVFQSFVTPKKLLQQVSRWTRIENGISVTVPVSKVSYIWQGEKLQALTTESWSETEGKFVANSRSEFEYNGDRVQRIRTYNESGSTLEAEDIYTYYSDGKVKHIEHKTAGAGTTNVEFVHEYTDRVITASYSHSNGSGFQYKFVSSHGSVKSDQTTRGNELCSEGQFKFDKNVNPTRHLGYVDYLLRNYSASNRLTEDVRYMACSFPSFAPESYSHQYDADGYPLQSTTHFKSSASKTVVEYSYVD